MERAAVFTPWMSDYGKEGCTMNVRNCRRCRKLFNYAIGPIYCSQCRQELEQEFQVVKKYVQDHPGSDIRTVSEACDIEPSQIRQWVREERLYFSEGASTGINCEHCGIMIRTGRFCDKCKADMTSNFRSAMRQTPVQSEPQKRRTSSEHKMRYIDSE